MRRGIWSKVLAAFAIAVGIPCAAEAGGDLPPAPPPPSSAWTFDGGLYGWALWVEGDATARGLTFDVYADPIDLIEHLDGPIIMANFEATRGRFSMFVDVIYAKFAMDSDFLGEAKPIPQLTLTGSGRIGADYEFGVYQADVFYEVANFAGAQGNNTKVELGGGARWVRQELDVTAGIDVSAKLELGRLLNVLRNRINRIQNQADKLQALAQLNALRTALLQKRVVLANDRGLEQRVARLEKRLGRVGERGRAIAALQTLDQFRLALLRSALSLNNSEISGNFAFIDSGVTEWVDPVIAMRVTHELGNGQSLTAMGDVGGFNTDSDFSWQVVLTYDQDGTFLGFDTTASFGYKALGLLFEESTANGTQGQNVVLHGPVAELTFRW